MKSLAHNDPSTVYLTTKPQRLGIVPTMKFWNTHTPLVCAAGFILPGVVASVLVVYGGTGILPGAVAGLASYWLPLGLFERYLRRKIREKNKLVARLSPEEPQKE